MKQIAGLLTSALVLCTGCATRFLDFTLVSTKNIELSRAQTFQRARARVDGEDRVHWIIIIPTGVPSAKEAMDRAIESVPGAVALVDGVITAKIWWIPYIYGQQKYVVEGTPLIDPALTSRWRYGEYLVTDLDDEGQVRETRSVSQDEYNALKARMVPATGS